MNDKPKLGVGSLSQLVTAVERRLSKYTVVMFLILLAATYGYVLFRISVLVNVQPSDADVTTQAKAAAVPHVDPTAVKQLESLQDNSVNVKSLFNQARSNPFHE